MTKKITYILGAGASALAIPTVDGMRDRLLDVKKFLESFLPRSVHPKAFALFSPVIRTKTNLLQFLIDDLDWLYVESEFHQTIDTLAKKYYIKDEQKLKRLKRTLIVYFTILQKVRIAERPRNGDSTQTLHMWDLMDKRYDNLIASIAQRVNGMVSLSPNIKVITWNYDMQIEMAINRYVEDTTNSIKKKFQILPNRDSLNRTELEMLDLANFATIKLNGNAFLDVDFTHGKGIANCFDKEGSDSNGEWLVEQLLTEFDIAFPNGELKLDDSLKYFHFAWESNPEFQDKHIGYPLLLSEAMRIMKETEILIIVGYSFPFFNFHIDRELFSQVWPDEIIIQDFQAQDILQSMESMFPSLFGPYSDDKPRIKFRLLNPGKYFPIHHMT